MKIAILGYGTVGSGVYEVLNMNREYIAKCAGQPVEIKYVLDLREFPGNPVMDVLVHDFKIIVEDPEIDIIAEVMGGTEPAYSFVKAALECGKAVCTSNKELVSKYGAELLELAEQKKTNFFFEASVGGGIPIIRPLNRSLTADDILEIRSIINGTTNYILTRMRVDGVSFEAALAEAQEKGYAERNPSADVDGIDSCRKTAILASLANGMQVECDDIYTEGITGITAEDIMYSNAMKTRIKLLSIVKRVEGKTYAIVAPYMIKDDCPLYHVEDVNNGIMVIGNAVGELMFYGSGAGKLPTASAVVADIVEAAKHKNINVVTIWSREHLKVEKHSDMKNSFFIRVPVSEREAASEQFEIDDLIGAGITGEFAFICKPVTEAEFEEKSKRLSVIKRIRFSQ